MEPEECDVVIDEASLGCTWDEFEKMRAFYRLALKSKRHVLFTTDA